MKETTSSVSSVEKSESEGVPKKETVAEKLARLKALKQKKKESEILNKKEVIQDLKNQKLKSIQARKDEAKINSAEDGEEVYKPQETKGNREYTIEEAEKWEAKKKSIGEYQQKRGYSNLNKLAELSYKKEIGNLEVDKESYEKDKKKQQQRAVQEGANIPVFDTKHSASAVASLVNNIQESNVRRMKRRRNKDDDEVSGYINDKNRQFNKKLNREYG
ncbi:Pre-mRNA-splicing factor SYF2 [Scheffersomyces xylosifermentans]|uniref:Pre-mRNA-splicing factor SYF2 n=1 Tax=Scheffersomyces xylosifermentans TaxID=1304137 RepID=UPI00315CF0DB